jgi:hypothetical protein
MLIAWRGDLRSHEDMVDDSFDIRGYGYGYSKSR